MPVANAPTQKVRLRDYQRDAIDATFRLLDEDPNERPLVVIPTGGGKSIILSETLRRFLEQNEDLQVLMLTHVKELVEQNYLAFRKVAPDISAGIFCASLNRKDTRQRVIFASVQSVANAVDKFRRVGLAVVDECHLVPHGSDGQYHACFQAFEAHAQARGDRLAVIGYTATPWRLSSGNLCEPFDGTPGLFTSVAYELPVSILLERGYLTQMVSQATGTRLKTDGIKKIAGEYSEKALNDAHNTDPLNAAIVKEIVEHGQDRKSWLVFAITIDHAERLAKLFALHGIEADCVHSNISKRDRDRVVRQFKAGAIRCLVNVGVLTTGFDAPNVDLIALCRATQSPGLYLQICGRGLRVVYADDMPLETDEERCAAIEAGPKPNCLLLDFAENVTRHGLVDKVVGVFKRGKKKPQARECAQCQTLNARDAVVCSSCGFPFPEVAGTAPTGEEREATLSARNTADRVMTSSKERKWIGVGQIGFWRHVTKRGDPCLRVGYRSPDIDQDIYTYWNFNARLDDGSPGWAATKAKELWRRHTTRGAAPKTSEEAYHRALRSEIRCPRRILIAQNSKGFFDVEAVEFHPQATQAEEIR